MLTYREMMAEIMWHKIFHDDAHGYSQYERSTNYSAKEEITLSDGTKVWIAAWDDDCSSGVRDNIIAVGLDPDCFTYTGNEAEGLLNSGQWIEISPYDADNGDVVLRNGHTEMVLDNDGQLAQGGFRISELGTIYGETGDQTGSEAAWSWYDPDAWEQCFRCIAVREEGPQTPPEPQPQQNPGEPKNNYGFTYRAHIQNLGWADPVRDGQTAGSVGYGARCEAIKITPIDNMKINVLLHIQDQGDVWYKGVAKGVYDPVMGTEGQAKRLEGFQIDVTERTGDAKNKIVYYRGHIQDTGWTGWVREGNFCGTRGQNKRLEAIQIMLVVEQDSSEPKNNNGLKYRAHTQDYGFLPIVRDGQIAGTTGQSRRLEAIQFIDIPNGLELDFHAHIENLGDIAYDFISKTNMPVMGTVGRGLRLEGFNIHVLKNDTGKKLKYQGHIENSGWTPVCEAGQPCGTSGQGLRLEAVKLWLE